MLFSSIIFIAYFLPLVLAIYFLVSFSRRLQNLWLILASLLFYAWGEPLFVLVMMGSIFINYLFGLGVDWARDNKKRSYWIIAGCVVFNVSVLFVFKYLAFFINNINALLGFTLFNFQSPPLPLGISFFTFQAMSYVIDVYRHQARLEKNPLNVGLFIAFFPALVAGPIVRFKDFADQIQKRVMTWDLFASGCARFTIGVGKKLILANALAVMADRIFALSEIGNQMAMVPAMLAWLGLIAYTLQIYYDFSSYSDMALGLAMMFGFKLRENFDYPYVSKSATEFWRRWHISMSSWFREYLYFPLGGSRPEIKYGPTLSEMSRNLVILRNLFVVWLITGLWHGAEWTFILWGLWYFVFLVFERTIGLEKTKIPSLIKRIYLLLVVSIGWLFFRATNFHEAMVYLGNLLGLNDNGFYSDLAVYLIKENWLFLILGIIFCAPVARDLGRMVEENRVGVWRYAFSLAYPVLLVALYLICLAYLVKGNYQPFIYFNF
jgi:alginate O-acetyltransferase complex protein AlgI